MIEEKHLQTLRQIYPLSEECAERLEIFVARLLEWQKKTNLVAPSTLDDIWSRHVADSLQCVALKQDTRTWLDIGSGGGFPGLVIAAVMAEHSNAEVSLVESLNKKTAFLRQTNRQMGAKAKVITSRIEDCYCLIKQPEVVTARALTSLPDLLDLCFPWLSQGATGLFHKGREYKEEIQDSRSLWEYDLIHHTSAISSESVILEIKNLKRKSG